MRDTLWLVRKTLVSTFKDYKNWLLYFGLPVAAIALAFFARGGEGDVQLNIGIVNGDNGQEITQDTIGFIDRMDSVVIHEIKEADMNGKIASGELDAALQFPAGFAQSVIVGRPELVRIAAAKGAEVTGYVQTNLNQYIDNLISIAAAAGGMRSDSSRCMPIIGKRISEWRLKR